MGKLERAGDIAKANLPQRASTNVIPFPGTSQEAAPPPQEKPQKEQCPRCKRDIDEYFYGWLPVRDSNGFAVYEPGPNGYPKQKLVPCPVCSPAALQRIAIRDRNRDLDRAFGGSNIPDSFQRYTFETFPKDGDKQAKEIMENIATGKAGRLHGAYLWGDKGHCKTGLVISTANVLMSRGTEVLYMRSVEYYRRIRERMFSKEINGKVVDVLDLSFKVRCFVLDDVGAEVPTGFVCSTLLDLVEERRAANGLLTFFTSNKSIRQLALSFGNGNEDEPGFRVAEKIAEDFQIIQVQGKKQRSALDMYE